jgi:hypothetical protein
MESALASGREGEGGGEGKATRGSYTLLPGGWRPAEQRTHARVPHETGAEQHAWQAPRRPAGASLCVAPMQACEPPAEDLYRFPRQLHLLWASTWLHISRPSEAAGQHPRGPQKFRPQVSPLQGRNLGLLVTWETRWRTCHTRPALSHTLLV